MKLVRIEAAKMEKTVAHVFNLYFSAADGSAPFAVLAAHELMDYGQAVAFIAQATGRIFLDGACEGLPREGANRLWRELVASYLNVRPQQPAAPSPVNVKKVN